MFYLYDRAERNGVRQFYHILVELPDLRGLTVLQRIERKCEWAKNRIDMICKEEENAEENKNDI